MHKVMSYLYAMRKILMRKFCYRTVPYNTKLYYITLFRIGKMTMKIASIVLLFLCMLIAQSVHSMASPATSSITERDTNEEFGDNLLDRDDVEIVNDESEMRLFLPDTKCITYQGFEYCM